MKRFWEKVKKTKNCWEWTGYIDAAGYGTFWWNRTNTYAHRASWRLNFGEIPKHLYVLHICDNRKCVRPTHLFLGTDYINSLDMVHKDRLGRIEDRARPKRKLTEQQVWEIIKLVNGGEHLQRDIAKRFNVQQVTISDIMVGRTWNCLTGFSKKKRRKRSLLHFQNTPKFTTTGALAVR